MHEIKVEAEMEQLYTVLDFFNSLFEKKKFDSKIKMQLDITIEEIFVNIASYAYEDCVGYVTVEFEFCGSDLNRCIAIKFTDSGTPYNPLENEDPDTHLSAERREIGGLGILMVKKTMDKTEYEYKEGFNIFTIYKNLK